MSQAVAGLVLLSCLLVSAACTTIATRTPPPPPTGAAKVIAFTASPNPVNRGGTVTLRWAVRNAARVNVWVMFPDYNFGAPWFRSSLESNPIASDQPATGSWTYNVPAHYDVPLRFELEAFDAGGVSVSARSDVVALTCYAFFFNPAPDCATAPPQPMPARYQPYEGGHVIWREDTSTFYVLYAYEATGRVGWRAYVSTWTNETGAVAVDEALGEPLAPAQDYTAQLQFYLAYEMTDSAYISLPDGRVIHLISYGGIDLSRGGPAWRVIEHLARGRDVTSPA